MSSGPGVQVGGIVFVFFAVVYLAVVVFELAALWRVFAKAGRPG